MSPFLFHPKQIWNLVTKSAGAWVDDYAPSMGAAIAYYTLFAIAPLLIIAIAVAGLVFGREAAHGEIVAQIQGLIGREGAIAVQGLLKSVNEPAQSIFATVVSSITLVIGATTVFAELQVDLDRIWRVPAPVKVNGVWALLRAHLLSFGLVLGLGFLMLVSLLVSAAIAAFGKWWSGFFKGWEAPFYAINFSISFATTTFLFAMIYKLMPRARIAFFAEHNRSESTGGQGACVVPADSHTSPALVGHGEIAGVYERISEALELLEYIPRGDRNIKDSIMVHLKHFIGRAGLTEWELKMLYGLCHQVEKKVARR